MARKENLNLEEIKRIADEKYQYGFETKLESFTAPKGLSEQVVRFISEQKAEPEWLLQSRLKAYEHFLTLKEPHWGKITYAPIDYQDIYYYAAQKKQNAPKSLDEVDPEILKTYEKLGIPLKEREILAGVAVDAVMQMWMEDKQNDR